MDQSAQSSQKDQRDAILLNCKAKKVVPAKKTTGEHSFLTQYINPQGSKMKTLSELQSEKRNNLRVIRAEQK